MDADKLTLQTALSTWVSLKMAILKGKARRFILTKLSLLVNLKREKPMATVLISKQMVTTTRDTWKTI
jgi:hypothetical protein